VKKYFWYLFCKQKPSLFKVAFHDSRVLYRPDIVSASQEAENHYSILANGIIILCIISMSCNVFHVRALYYTKTLITNKCTKRILSSIVNTLLHVSTLLRHLQGELLCHHHTKVALYSWVRMCCWLRTALFLEAWTLCTFSLNYKP
jgi:hypothetical protein